MAQTSILDYDDGRPDVPPPCEAKREGNRLTLWYEDLNCEVFMKVHLSPEEKKAIQDAELTRMEAERAARRTP